MGPMRTLAADGVVSVQAASRRGERHLQRAMAAAALAVALAVALAAAALAAAAAEANQALQLVRPRLHRAPLQRDPYHRRLNAHLYACTKALRIRIHSLPIRGPSRAVPI